MNRYLKITEYAYLIIAIFLTEETIRNWGTPDSKSIFYIIMALLAFFMFLFKRWYRKKIERENSN